MLAIIINTDNAAFQDNPDELASVLRTLARLAHSNAPAELIGETVQDTNGNTVCRVFGEVEALRYILADEFPH